MRTALTMACATALIVALPTLGLAQSASTVGAGSVAKTPSGTSGTVGSGGSAATGGTSASTLGLGASSQGPSGSSSSLGTAGSAAADEGKVKSSSKLHGNEGNLHGMSKAKAQDGGTWSKSMTKTKVKDDTMTSRTKSMAHEPGGAPAKSTTGVTTNLR